MFSTHQGRGIRYIGGTSELTNYTSATQKMKTDSFQKDYTRSQAIAVTNGLQLGFKVAAKGVVALAGADSFITRTIKKSR
ncbi:hypothetical protein J6TS7_24710 [Paenibacillus dendritiformis]|nr:hypothetical protein J6TS7_24710 [Paenibacillus dendritiformis]